MDQKLDLTKMIENIFNQSDPSDEARILKDLPHNPINLKNIIKKATSEKRFKLNDRVPGKPYTIETYRVGNRNYITIVSESVDGKSCMRPIEKDIIASRHTKSMISAVQLHHDALGYLGYLGG